MRSELQSAVSMVLFNEVGQKGPTDKEQFEQKPVACKGASHAEKIEDREEGFQMEGTTTAKALRWE